MENMSEVLDKALNGSKKVRVTFKRDAINGVRGLWQLRNEHMITISGFAEANLSAAVTNQAWSSDIDRSVLVTFTPTFDKYGFMETMGSVLEKIEPSS